MDLQPTDHPARRPRDGAQGDQPPTGRPPGFGAHRDGPNGEHTHSGRQPADRPHDDHSPDDHSPGHNQPSDNRPHDTHSPGDDRPHDDRPHDDRSPGDSQPGDIQPAYDRPHGNRSPGDNQPGDTQLAYDRPHGDRSPGVGRAGEGGSVEDLVPIGRFARLTGLTVKALRHYDALALLSPAHTDPTSRHRWYAAEQLEPARRIRRLRELDLPLSAVRAVLAAPDGGRELLSAYRRDVEAQLARDQRILHGLTHLIEGDNMTQSTASAPQPSSALPDSERQLAADLFNLVWTLLEQTSRTVEDDDRMVHAAHASRYHWGQVGGPEQLAIGEWQCARVYSVLGRAEPALHHARRCLEIATAATVPDWLVASAHEGLARAYAVAGQRESALASQAAAEAVLAKVADGEDRQIVQDDLASLPL